MINTKYVKLFFDIDNKLDINVKLDIIDIIKEIN